ncbi:Nuclear transport factor (karyopherin) [Komagataella phaffii CBS 7435]|uniref:Nuclear transport factor (Karyopherin) n=2 Tax=Komagataella phaffii TaxID=460519 RepID=C4R5V4_KOMPG|nr:Nuclear transport factor (karyopherin) [Komagataella phaffii GS115]AOA63589.1 GQ67_04005T0 [Komagataella phaffii]CAH2449245.1 Nuclear transport factor (karyopherin) [Komagataella phaffii CBS 7435]AOA69185.1 GQ68_03978T0 [Komagataella phaffii GS115]CAY70940.1 Nuclear transport factor (karyopherin) [Komagataella phaffii GS115]CCA39261.1 Nuclear transport factor (karyopherin) [Komagataella phaffii CBS 7435]
MDKQNLLLLIEASLSNDASRNHDLSHYLDGIEHKPGVAEFFFDLVGDNSLKAPVKLFVAVYFKNKVKKHWNINGNDSWELQQKQISPEEKASIKSKFVQVFLANCQDNKVSQLLCDTLYLILQQEIDQWDQLTNDTLQLLHSKDKYEYVYSGLLILKTFMRTQRWSLGDDRRRLDLIVENSFELLESLMDDLVSNGLDDTSASNLIYQILKIFKYATFTSMPQYFIRDIGKLEKWVSYQLTIASSESSSSLMALDVDRRTVDPRSKSQKWAFANLCRLIGRYGGGKSMSREAHLNQFCELVTSNFAPEILTQVFKIASNWSQNPESHWLSQKSLYYLIFTIHQFVNGPYNWKLVQPHIREIIAHLVLPNLLPTDDVVELYESDPDEYYKRYIDFGNSTTTANDAAVNLLAGISEDKLKQIYSNTEDLVVSCFTNEKNNPFQVEASLRVLACFSLQLNQSDWDVEGIVKVTLPYLNAKEYPFLQTRACDLITCYGAGIRDLNLLSEVFQGLLKNFQQDDDPLLILLGAEAITVLISRPEVSDSLRPHINSIISKLLKLSNEYEFEAVSDIIQAFVSEFSAEVQPFALQLFTDLNENFQRIMKEMIDNRNDTDKEYQGIGVLDTMLSIVNSSDNVDHVTRLADILRPTVLCTIQNTLDMFLVEVLSICETIVSKTKQVSQALWDVYMELFDSASYYFIPDVCQPFWEACIIYGFKDLNFKSPQVQKAIEIISNAELFEDYPKVQYELLSQIILACDVGPVIPDILKLSNTSEPCIHIEIVLSCLVTNPQLTVSNIDLTQFLPLWMNNQKKSPTVFDVKLQILALISLLGLDGLSVIEQVKDELTLKLVQLLETLPETMRKRQELLDSLENAQEDDFEYEEDEEDDLLRETILDNVDVLSKFKQFNSTGRITVPQERLRNLQ